MKINPRLLKLLAKIKINPKLLVDDANNRNIYKISLLVLEVFISAIMVFLLVTDSAKSLNFGAVILIIITFIVFMILWFEFPKKCSKDGLPLKYWKSEKISRWSPINLFFSVGIYRCPRGHIHIKIEYNPF